jgi:hypothetical protein
MPSKERIKKEKNRLKRLETKDNRNMKTREKNRLRQKEKREKASEVEKVKMREENRVRQQESREKASEEGIQKTKEENRARIQEKREKASEENKEKEREENLIRIQEMREKASEVKKEKEKEENRVRKQAMRDSLDYIPTLLSVEQLERKRHNESVRQIHVRLNESQSDSPYHEAQEFGYCAVHALNMALGQKAVSYDMLMESAIDNAVMFQQITNNLTQHDLQARATALPGGQLGEFRGYQDEGYQPAREDGWFDADSVENCLRKLGFDFVRFQKTVFP